MHQSVLLRESIAGLAIKPNGIYVDGTFGRGGHSLAILQQLGPHGRLIAIDKDLEAIEYGRKLFAKETRVQLYHGSFADIEDALRQYGIHSGVQGVLLDLGVSSPQLDCAQRGFSFLQTGPLDMRMNIDNAISAASFVAKASVEEMIYVFRTYGEERYAGRIARAIVDARTKQPILTTTELAAIIQTAHPKWEKHKHPATRVFQAIRIHVNAELADLQRGLDASLRSLAIGGRLAVISFHSLEDRIVKQFMQHAEQGDDIPHNIPIKATDLKICFRRMGKAVKPHEDEIKDNRRSRSAVLRIGEKIA